MRKGVLSLLMLFAITCMVLSVSAQVADSCTLVLSGRVIDEHDQSRLSYSTIYLIGPGKGTAADENGEFEIRGLCPGTYALRYSHIGCETKVEQLILTSDLDLDLYLEHHIEHLETIQVKGAGIEGPASQSREVLQGAELIDVQGRSLGQSLEGLTGVRVLQTGPTVFKPVIHGMHSSRIAILNEGVRLEGQNWGLDHAPEVDPFSGDRISVVKGAASVQYGTDAMGGVVLLETSGEPPDSLWHGKAQLLGATNGRSGAAGLRLGRNFGRHAWFLQGSVRRAGDFHAPDYSLTNTGLAEYSLAGGMEKQFGQVAMELRYTYFHNELAILRSAHIGNLTDLENALNSPVPLYIEPFSYAVDQPKQEVDHHVAQLRAEMPLKAIGVLDLDYSIQINNRQEFDVRRGGRSDIPALDLRLVSQAATAVLEHSPKLGGLLRGKLGLGWQYQVNQNIPGTGVRPLIPDYDRISPHFFISEKWLETLWEIELGIRYEYQLLKVKKFDINNQLQKPSLDFHNIAINLGGVYRPGQSLTLRSNLGYGERAPNMHELFSEGLHHGAGAIEEGSQDLKAERALKWVTGITLENDNYAFEVVAYQQWFDGYIYLQPEAEPRLTIRGAFPVFSYRQADAFVWGLDLTGKVELSEALDIASGFSLVRGRNRDQGIDLLYLPSDRMTHRLEYQSDPGLRWLSTLGASIRYTYTWEQTRVPPASDYAPPPDGYHLVGMHVTGEFPLAEKKLRATIGVKNLFNTSYREYLNRLRYYADEPGRNFELQLVYQF